MLLARLGSPSNHHMSVPVAWQSALGSTMHHTLKPTAVESYATRWARHSLAHRRRRETRGANHSPEAQRRARWPAHHATATPNLSSSGYIHAEMPKRVSRHCFTSATGPFATASPTQSQSASQPTSCLRASQHPHEAFHLLCACVAFTRIDAIPRIPARAPTGVLMRRPSCPQRLLNSMCLQSPTVHTQWGCWFLTVVSAPSPPKPFPRTIPVLRIM